MIIYDTAATQRAALIRSLASSVVLASLLLLGGCGGAGEPPPQVNPYPALTADVEQQLRLDSRVDDFEIEGEKLVVNVNDHWVQAPHGMQERSLGQWYNLWRTTRGGNSDGKPPAGLQVVVRYEGEDVGRWTEDGYEPVVGPTEPSAKQS